ncbi:endonuclease/exonuclease/phosphatase family protein [uncultured Cetobacterium sp.]|uniref:endonuclease/exonuclease/phosphatase family protein n=1 Tax=uncultured Cetobacterium sp. TaxID=527638 RepID=UPI0025DB10D2|nr:endonuclease/exonuclease/phosphatase family protein [uncultured Cetobacterium sp.]
MKLLTLNCHSWQEENQIEKMKYLAEVIVQEGYDIIALQEVNQLIADKIVYSDVRESNFAYILCEELKKIGVIYNFVWDYHHIGYDVFHEGTGILFKGEIEEHISDFIGTSKDTNFWKSRKFTMISQSIGEEIVDFYSCHLGWWNDSDNSFEKQVDDLLKFANERGNRYFLMGDFNNDANVRGEGYDYLLERGLRDTYSYALKSDDGVTVPGAIAGWEGKCNASKRIDFILSNRDELKIKSSEVIFNGKNRDVISDHFGVAVETF